MLRLTAHSTLDDQPQNMLAIRNAFSSPEFPALERDLPEEHNDILKTPEPKHLNILMYTSGLALHNLSATTFNLPPQPQHHDLLYSVNAQLVPTFPSDQQQQWPKGINAQIKKLRSFLLDPETATQKIVSGIARTPAGWAVPHFRNMEKYQPDFLLKNGLQHQSHWGSLFMATLVMAFFSQKPSLVPHSQQSELCATMIEAIQDPDRSPIPPYYVKKITLIVMLIDHLAKHTGLTPQVLFERTHIPTPLCHLLALADRTILITLPGIAQHYDGEYTIKQMLADLTLTLTACLLGESVNGQLPKQGRLFVSGCFGGQPQRDQVILSRTAHSFLKWASKKTNCFKDLPITIAKKQVQPLKLLLACHTILHPFAPLENIPAFKTSTHRPELVNCIAQITHLPSFQHQQWMSMLQHIPSLFHASKNTYQHPSDWWCEKGIIQYQGDKIKPLLSSVYSFAVQELSALNLTTQLTNSEDLIIPQNISFTCTTSTTPILSVMALNHNQIVLAIPTMDAIRSIHCFIDAYILFHTLASGIPNALTMLQKHYFVPPTLTLLKSLEHITEQITAEMLQGPSLI